MQRVIIIGTAYPYRAGGLATFNERLARAMQAAGHDTQIYTFRLQYPRLLFPGTSQYAPAQDSPPIDLRITRAINSLSPWNWWRVGKKILHLTPPPDLIIVRYWTPFMAPCLGTILRIVRRNRHTRIIAITDNIIPHEKHFFDPFLTRYFLSSLHAAITLSESVRKELKHLAPQLKHIRTLKHPLYDHAGTPQNRSDARAQLGIAKDEMIFLFFGFIRAYKGLSMLLDAFAEITQKTPHARLLIAGEFYESKEPYLTKIKKLELGDKIILHNHFIPNESITHYFCAADAVVQPYQHGSQSGVSALSMYFERVVIVTRVGGIYENVEDGKTGFICEANSPCVARAMLRFATLSQDEKADMEALIRKEKQQYSWDFFVQKIEDLYTHIALG